MSFSWYKLGKRFRRGKSRHEAMLYFKIVFLASSMNLQSSTWKMAFVNFIRSTFYFWIWENQMVLYYFLPTTDSSWGKQVCRGKKVGNFLQLFFLQKERTWNLISFLYLERPDHTKYSFFFEKKKKWWWNLFPFFRTYNSFVSFPIFCSVVLPTFFSDSCRRIT